MHYKSLALIILINLTIPQVSFGFCPQPYNSIEYQMCRQNELHEEQIQLQQQAINQQRIMQQEQLEQQRQLEQWRSIERNLNQKPLQVPYLF